MFVGLYLTILNSLSLLDSSGQSTLLVNKVYLASICL